MARLMSVALTTDAVRRRQKSVTRRVGWQMLRPGDQLTLCPKVRGRRPGEQLDRIVTVDVVSVRREPLNTISPADVTAEGFPDMTPAQFIDFFCSTHRGVSANSQITRIEWAYPRVCRQCGCTEYSACDHPIFGPCGWLHTYDDNTGICTACTVSPV
ncbi:hypothetical protein AB0876_31620 [Mycobacterium sp. NPDC049093]